MGQVIVPDGMDPSDLATKASDIATPGSAVSKAFTDAMKSESLPVSDLELVAAPRTYTSTVVKGKDGIVIPKPSKSTTTTVGSGSGSGDGGTTAAEEEEGG